MQTLKRRKLAATTVNKTLKQLRAILRTAERWGVINTSLKIVGVKQPDRHPKFYDFGEYRLLTRAAKSLNPETYAAVRLGGDAGLRCGEILGLKWPNVHFDRRKLYICDNLVHARDEHGAWVIRVPKGGRPRWIPISGPLEKALKALERRGDHVITNHERRHLTPTRSRAGSRGLRSAPASRPAGLTSCAIRFAASSCCGASTCARSRSSPGTPSWPRPRSTCTWSARSKSAEAGQRIEASGGPML